MVSNEEIKQMLEAKRKGVDIEKLKIERENYKICPYCKTKNLEKAIFCVHCGKKMDANLEIKCPSCDYNNPKEAKFCVNCGENLKVTEEKELTVKNEETIKNDELTTPDVTVTEEDESTPKTELADTEVSKPKIPRTKIPTTVPEHAIITKTGAKKTCPNCNGKNLKNAKFCVVCGEKLEEHPTNEKIEPNSIEETHLKPESQEIDPVEKIKKAKELLDIGAITSEEFENIKKKYLDKI